MYFNNKVIEGITWEFVNNYYIKFNDDYTDRPGLTAATHIVKDDSITDEVRFIGNIKDTSRATWYDSGNAFGEQVIDNATNDDALLNPAYNLTGFDYDDYKGQWWKSWDNDGVNYLTWAIGDVVSSLTDTVGTRFYICIAAHTSVIGSDLVTDTSQWPHLTWDESGVRIDEGGWASGDTQSNLPPDNFKLPTADFWNSLNMGLPFNDDIITNTIFKWYYADDASGTGKVLIAGANEATIDIDGDVRNAWLSIKTGKYIVGSVTPVDINGLMGVETFATGIII
jgi:hypothetical protein